ncbi:hypothetical protein ACFORG_18680, partial [Lutimaribacter marinistellae]
RLERLIVPKISWAKFINNLATGERSTPVLPAPPLDLAKSFSAGRRGRNFFLFSRVVVVGLFTSSGINRPETVL